jgi:hypothetical protein
VSEFSFVTVSEGEIYDAVMSIRSDVADVDGIPLLFKKLLLPVVLPVLTLRSAQNWKTSVVLPIAKVGSPAKFSDYKPISLLVCLSRVFVVLMARQMERHICEVLIYCAIVYKRELAVNSIS